MSTEIITTHNASMTITASQQQKSPQLKPCRKSSAANKDEAIIPPMILTESVNVPKPV